jgi:hypothetical protein
LRLHSLQVFYARFWKKLYPHCVYFGDPVARIWATESSLYCLPGSLRSAVSQFETRSDYFLFFSDIDNQPALIGLGY